MQSLKKKHGVPCFGSEVARAPEFPHNCQMPLSFPSPPYRSQILYQASEEGANIDTVLNRSFLIFIVLVLRQI